MTPKPRDECATATSTSPRVDAQKNSARSRSGTPNTQADSNPTQADSRPHDTAPDGMAPDGVGPSPAKRMKRGKYISRACTSCQRRKIKCEGGDPCAQCVARRRPCVSVPRSSAGSSQHAQGDAASADNARLQQSSADNVYV
ncbi:hypothetical protein SEUCBS139899_002869 [Sporothrix eucalyptigena]